MTFVGKECVINIANVGSAAWNVPEDLEDAPAAVPAPDPDSKRHDELEEEVRRPEPEAVDDYDVDADLGLD